MCGAQALLLFARAASMEIVDGYYYRLVCPQTHDAPFGKIEFMLYCKLAWIVGCRKAVE